MILNFTLFILFPYICIILFIIGVFYKGITMYNKLQNTKSPIEYLNTVNNSKLLLSGVLGLFAIHILGYILIKALFVLTNLSAYSITSLSKIIEATLLIIFLSIFTYIAFYKRIKQKYYIFSNFKNNIIAVIIFLHIVLGYLGIMLVDDPINKSEKALSFKLYIQGLFSFDLLSYLHLAKINIVSKGHLILGLIFIAILPYTNIVELLFSIIFKILYRAKKMLIN